MILWKCCTQYVSKFGKLNSGHRTGKGQFSFQFQRKTMPKSAQYSTIALISHANKVMLKVLQARFQKYVNHELPDVQAEFNKGNGTRHQIANIRWIIRKAREFQKNIYYLLLLYWHPKPLTVWTTTNCGKFFKRDGNIRPPYLPPEKSVCRSKSNS